MAEMSRVRASVGEMRDASDDVNGSGVNFVADVGAILGEPFGPDAAGVADGVEEAVALDKVVEEYGGSAPIWSKR